MALEGHGKQNGAEVLGLHLLRIGATCARQEGLTGEALQDCAGELAIRVLDKTVLPTFETPVDLDCWLWHEGHQCAENFVRRDLRLHQRETLFSEESEEPGEGKSEKRADEQAGPDTSLLRTELRQLFDTEMLCLTAHQRDLFRQHHIHGLSFADLAAIHNCSARAIKAAIKRAEDRIRSGFERHAVDEKAALDYLVTIAASRWYSP